MTGHDGRTVVRGFAFDPVCGPFRRGEISDDEAEHPGLGITLAYSGADGYATVHVYDRLYDSIPDGAQSEIVDNEFDRARHDISAHANLGGAEVDLLDIDWVTADALEFLYGSFALTDERGSRSTFLFLTGLRNQFLKVRLTLDAFDEKHPTPRAFMDHLARTLR